MSQFATNILSPRNIISELTSSSVDIPAFSNLANTPVNRNFINKVKETIHDMLVNEDCRLSVITKIAAIDFVKDDRVLVDLLNKAATKALGSTSYHNQWDIIQVIDLVEEYPELIEPFKQGLLRLFTHSSIGILRTCEIFAIPLIQEDTALLQEIKKLLIKSISSYNYDSLKFVDKLMATEVVQKDPEFKAAFTNIMAHFIKKVLAGEFVNKDYNPISLVKTKFVKEDLELSAMINDFIKRKVIEASSLENPLDFLMSLVEEQGIQTNHEFMKMIKNTIETIVTAPSRRWSIFSQTKLAQYTGILIEPELMNNLLEKLIPGPCNSYEIAYFDSCAVIHTDSALHSKLKAWILRLVDNAVFCGRSYNLNILFSMNFVKNDSELLTVVQAKLLHYISNHELKSLDLIELARISYVHDDLNLQNIFKTRLSQLITSKNVDVSMIAKIASIDFVKADPMLTEGLKELAREVFQAASYYVLSLEFITFILKAAVPLDEEDAVMLQALLVNRLMRDESTYEPYRKLPLHAAASYDPILLKFLLDMGGYDFRQEDAEEKTAIDIVFEKHSPKSIDLLPLITKAAIERNIDDIIYLINKDATLPLRKLDGASGKILIDISAEQDELHHVMMMLSAMLKNTCDADHYAILSILIANNAFDVVKYLSHNGINLNASDKLGTSLVTNTATRGELEKLQKLLELGADINMADKEGYTTLHLAASSGNFELVKYLASMGANINARTNEGYTALHSAIIASACKGCERNLEMIKFFVTGIDELGEILIPKDRRADLTLIVNEDSVEVSVFDIAVESNANEIMEYLSSVTEELASIHTAIIGAA